MFKSPLYAILIVLLLLPCAVPALAQTVASKQDEPKLIAVLQDADAPLKAKIDAGRQLAIIGGKNSIAPLAALLGDEKLSHVARYGLERNPDPAVDEALRSALGQVRGRPLVGVITSIGVRRDAKAVPALAGLLKDSDAVTARATARAMGSIATTEAATALQQALPKAAADRRLDVCEGLFRCAERLAAGGRNEQAIAIYDQLRKLDGAHQVRAGALRGAILARGADGATLLQEHLRSSDYILFSAAVQTAQTMRDAEVTKSLLDAMKDLPADNQIVVIEALGVRGDKQAVPALLAAAKAGPAPVRVAAMRAATEMGDASAVPVLVELLDDPDRDVAGVAQDCLVALPGEQADAAVAAMFGGNDTEKRLTALDMIGRRRMVSSMPALFKATTDSDPRVRRAAIRMAGEMASPEQVPALLDLLAQADQRGDLAAVEQALMTACTKTGDPQTITETLTGRLGKAGPPQKAVLLRVLAAVGGPDALKAVRASLDSSDADVRGAAIRALSTWKSADAAPYLLTLAKDAKDPGERTLALRGYLNLAARGDIDVEERLAMAHQAATIVQRDDEKRLLLGTLGNIGSPAAATLIAPYLDDPAVKQEAALAVVGVAERFLRGRGAKDATALIQPLEKVTQSTDNQDVVTRARTLLRRAKNQ
ncbi:MAG: HEAT repeat domain-containing protein [Planctomycetes bacterium]|nr:HEAT repeat domain-containing protein [Planctomycetota bacterium]